MRLFKAQHKTMTDESLMQAISTGDKRAFDELYARYTGPLLGYFMKMLWRDREKSEDFVHDLFAKIVNKPEYLKSVNMPLFIEYRTILEDIGKNIEKFRKYLGSA